MVLWRTVRDAACLADGMVKAPTVHLTVGACFFGRVGRLILVHKCSVATST